MNNFIFPSNKYVYIIDPASITTITTPIMKDEGGMAYLVCNAKANPKIDNMVRWSRDNYDMSKTRQMYDNGTSYLTVYELSRTDTGTFTCSAYNGFGKVVTRVAQLIVKCKLSLFSAMFYLSLIFILFSFLFFLIHCYFYCLLRDFSLLHFYIFCFNWLFDCSNWIVILFIVF